MWLGDLIALIQEDDFWACLIIYNSKVAQVFRNALNDVFKVSYGDEWDARYLPQPTLQVFIVGSDEVASMLLDTINYTVISVCASVSA